MKIKLIALTLILCLTQTSCYVGRYIFWNFADIDDYKKFQSISIENSSELFYFTETGNKFKPDSIAWNGKNYAIETFLKENNTAAFIIIRNDSLLYEEYFNDFSKNSMIPSFSASKPIVSALIGIAISEGAIKSVDQPISDFLPELKRNELKKITIEHLLNMRSGIKYNESLLNPFGNIANAYYGRNLAKKMKSLKVAFPPDSVFKYTNYNTQLLSFILERATGKLLPEYLEEKIWKPLGMEFDATWSIDSKKHKEAKAFCCLNARARDYAKIGRLYLNHGNWNGKQIVPEEWVNKSTSVTKESKDLFYSYQWWHNITYKKISDTLNIELADNERIVEKKSKNGDKTKYLAIPKNDFMANGYLGQFIYVYPQKNIIIVRLGDKSDVRWPSLFLQLAKSL